MSILSSVVLTEQGKPLQTTTIYEDNGSAKIGAVLTDNYAFGSAGGEMLVLARTSLLKSGARRVNVRMDIGQFFTVANPSGQTSKKYPVTVNSTVTYPSGTTTSNEATEYYSVQVEESLNQAAAYFKNALRVHLMGGL